MNIKIILIILTDNIFDPNQIIMDEYYLLVEPQVEQLENDLDENIKKLTREWDTKIQQLRDNFFQSFKFENYDKISLDDLDKLSEEHLIFLVYTILGYRRIPDKVWIRSLCFSRYHCKTEEDVQRVYLSKLKECLRSNSCKICNSIYHSTSKCHT